MTLSEGGGNAKRGKCNPEPCTCCPLKAGSSNGSLRNPSSGPPLRAQRRSDCRLTKSTYFYAERVACCAERAVASSGGARVERLRNAGASPLQRVTPAAFLYTPLRATFRFLGLFFLLLLTPSLNGHMLLTDRPPVQGVRRPDGDVIFLVFFFFFFSSFLPCPNHSTCPLDDPNKSPSTGHGPFADGHSLCPSPAGGPTLTERLIQIVRQHWG